MDQISDLSHGPCFHTRFFPPPSARAGVIKVCSKTKVAFISSRHAVSAAGVAGDLLPEKPASLETMATAARPRFVANDGDGESHNLASAEKKRSKRDLPPLASQSVSDVIAGKANVAFVCMQMMLFLHVQIEFKS